MEHPYSIAAGLDVGFDDLTHTKGERSRTSRHVADTDNDVGWRRERNEVYLFKLFVNHGRNIIIEFDASVFQTRRKRIVCENSEAPFYPARKIGHSAAVIRHV